MKKCFLLFAVLSLQAAAFAADTEMYCSVDRETAGLMDTWLRLKSGSGSEFIAGTALIRAESALAAALKADIEDMPEEAETKWKEYLEASADCLFTFRLALKDISSMESEDILVASFTRWTTAGEEFLNSVQYTR